MSKKLWIASVLGLVVAAFFLLRSSDDRSGGSKAGPRTGRSSDQQVRPRFVESNSDTVRETRRKPMPDEKGRTNSESTEPTQEYVRNDGSEVRDHRENPPLPQLEAIAGVPTSISPVSPKILMALRQTLRPKVHKCGQSIAAGSVSARAQVVITASIAAEQLTIDTLKITTEAISEAEEADFISCVEEKMRDHSPQVDGAQDVQGHTMTFPFDLE